MKIAFVSAAESVHTVRWANAMKERGHDVTVISCANDATETPSAYYDGVHIIKLKYKAPLGYYLNARQLRRIVKKEKFDVVNVHYASGYGTLGRRARIKNALLNIWGSDVYEFPYQSAFKMKLIKKNLRYYKYAASTSYCMAAQAKRLYDREYFITPFGVDTCVFKPLQGIKPKDKIIFGTVKTLSPKYGIADTVKAFILLNERLVKENRTDLADRLYYEIYGKGELKDELQKLIDENAMSDKISLCGYVDNRLLPEIYNRFTISNSNSNRESFGVAAVEAMACGIPVQVSDADGFAEVVEDGVTGLIAPKGDVAAIAENMYRLLTDNKLRREMSLNAVDRVRRLYEWQNNVDEMLKIYAIISDK